MNTYQFPRFSINYREETNDLDIIRSAYPQYSKLCKDIARDDIVIDAGAHIGIFTLLAMINKPEKIYAYEIVKENYLLLKDNVGKSKKVKTINKGIAKKEGDYDLYPTQGKGTAGSNIYITKKRSEPIQVECVSAKSLFELKPTVLKLDCEGAEYDVIDAIPKRNRLRIIFVEWHFKLQWREFEKTKDDYARNLDKLLSMGFTPKKIPLHPDSIGKKFVTMNTFYRR